METMGNRTWHEAYSIEASSDIATGKIQLKGSSVRASQVLYSNTKQDLKGSVGTMAQKVKGIVRTTLFALVASVVFIILGLIFFMIFLWIVKTGADLLDLEGLNANWAVFAAAILASTTVLGAAIESR